MYAWQRSLRVGLKELVPIIQKGKELTRVPGYKVDVQE